MKRKRKRTYTEDKKQGRNLRQKKKRRNKRRAKAMHHALQNTLKCMGKNEYVAFNADRSCPVMEKERECKWCDHRASEGAKKDCFVCGPVSLQKRSHGIKDLEFKPTLHYKNVDTDKGCHFVQCASCKIFQCMRCYSGFMEAMKQSKDGIHDDTVARSVKVLTVDLPQLLKDKPNQQHIIQIEPHLMTCCTQKKKFSAFFKESKCLRGSETEWELKLLGPDTNNQQTETHRETCRNQESTEHAEPVPPTMGYMVMEEGIAIAPDFTCTHLHALAGKHACGHLVINHREALRLNEEKLSFEGKLTEAACVRTQTLKILMPGTGPRGEREMKTKVQVVVLNKPKTPIHLTKGSMTLEGLKPMAVKSIVCFDSEYSTKLKNEGVDVLAVFSSSGMLLFGGLFGDAFDTKRFKKGDHGSGIFLDLWSCLSGSKKHEKKRTGGANGLAKEHMLDVIYMMGNPGVTGGREKRAVAHTIMGTEVKVSYFSTKQHKMVHFKYSVAKPGGQLVLTQNQYQGLQENTKGWVKQFVLNKAFTAELLRSLNTSEEFKRLLGSGVSFARDVQNVQSACNDAAGRYAAKQKGEGRLEPLQDLFVEYLARSCIFTILAHPVGWHKDRAGHQVNGHKVFVENKELFVLTDPPPVFGRYGRGGCPSGGCVGAIIDHTWLQVLEAVANDEGLA
ncbi:expressed unknown protein [Seminavis robusta]|uniref:Uncharacterized protein n=1 Tax=Seminavis robusta TaxID=568900 RepID=A0A9N8D734_9STRA|nr:expressed unknown protein [Seminavis robusta]|eukprot:Sro23_g015570.1 n/a (675) ;mRNA; f:17190-19214